MQFTRDANAASIGELDSWPRFTIRWSTRRGWHLSDRALRLAAEVILVEICTLLIAHLVLSAVFAPFGGADRQTTRDFVGPYVYIGAVAVAAGAIARVRPKARRHLRYRDNETAACTMTVSPRALTIVEERPDGSQSRVEIQREDAGDLLVDYEDGYVYSVTGRTIDLSATVCVDDRRVQTDPALGRVEWVHLTTVLASWWPDNARSHDALLTLQRVRGSWRPPGAASTKRIA